MTPEMPADVTRASREFLRTMQREGELSPGFWLKSKMDKSSQPVHANRIYEWSSLTFRTMRKSSASVFPIIRA